ncbi:MAG: hypothetical protein AAGC68_03330 [Verrucomicrobiota bacterium]
MKQMNWYVSLTMRWYEQPGSQAFLDACDETSIGRYQARVPRERRHCTLFAFARFSEVKGKEDPRESARSFHTWLRKAGFRDLAMTFSSFEAKPIEKKFFPDTATTIQFEDSSALAGLREKTGRWFRETWNRSPWPLNSEVPCTIPFHAPDKNEGSLLFGSIARTAFPDYEASEQMRPLGELPEFSGTKPFPARELILTVSDDFLMNPLAPKLDTIRIPLRAS